MPKAGPNRAQALTYGASGRAHGLPKVHLKFDPILNPLLGSHLVLLGALWGHIWTQGNTLQGPGRAIGPPARAEAFVPDPIIMGPNNKKGGPGRAIGPPARIEAIVPDSL